MTTLRLTQNTETLKDECCAEIQPNYSRPLHDDTRIELCFLVVMHLQEIEEMPDNAALNEEKYNLHQLQRITHMQGAILQRS